MLLRGFPTRIFISKIYPKHPDYFKRLLNLAQFTPYFKQKCSNNYQILKGVDKSVHYRIAECIEEFKFIKNSIPNETPVTYLEFGVFEGTSISNASKIFTHQNSRFIGFDTFEGLPEPFLPAGHKIGTFTTNGKIPIIPDSRVFFIKGLFQNTLANFMQKLVASDKNDYGVDLKNSQLIINLDADLYSSTLYCLTQLDPIIEKDTIIRFDEFSSLEDEWLALRDYARSYYRDFEIIASSSDRWHTIIRIIK